MRISLITFFKSALDFIFPPTPAELELRALSPEIIFDKLPRAAFSPHPFITSLFAYKHPLTHELVRSIKQRKDRHAFELAGYAMYRELSKSGRLQSQTILIPIPLSKQRFKERGYNQCELLIDEIIRLDAEKIFKKESGLLSRIKDSGQQKLKNRKERLASSQSIFSVRTGLFPSDARLIIIDDVSTTGSTIKEARDALLQAGYGDVKALTLAH